jgi:pyruvate/2-oxoglutarate dehydrogenase complex dihydrolipoamide dehydrogenase (E3) component
LHSKHVQPDERFANQLAALARPQDVEDERWLARVRPAGWKNPTPSGTYNLVVIGAGTAGLVTAAGAAGLGAKVALIERGLFGGDCLNHGCVPSKALLRCARVAMSARDVSRFGVRTSGPIDVDFQAVMARMRGLRAQIAENDAVQRFRALGIDVFLGEARFIAPDRVRVDGTDIRFARACIATGSQPRIPDIQGLESSGYVTNETIFSLDQLPRRMAIVGAGPIGCELGQAFAVFGSNVILIDHGTRILAHDEADAALVVQTALERAGVEMRFGRDLERVERRADAKHLTLKTQAGREELDVDAILVCVGRTPETAGLDLETAGVEADERGVRVDDHLRTTNRRIFAAGDVCLPEKFTHTADAAARIVIQNALFFGRKKQSALHIPWCTYTQPELAHTGLTPEQIAERGLSAVTETIPFTDVDRSILDGEDAGFLRVHADARSGRILGATIVGEHAGEMITHITAAMVAGWKLRDLSSVIHPYPTRSEAVRRAADASNRRRLTPGRKRFLEWFLARRR